ncbi:NADPH-dependent pterin aldehyde reductase-like [Cucurbita pepo subsp. pepo]|uniref:NADPH-dependent pterin aldehyde reductase-like n=1 Tax=Cucurbita pepo subsp. pepo TaxID=3664 RepID=UPI000C9D5951|nr:NADPH-dependent pterin aldehyde reductase-like [Cucurbita pepo subsp. pepo]XP_023539755.1 NADPH-dependent pterin aldehyde reductase-like [Cucurbita pepo subsp. pepo]
MDKGDKFKPLTVLITGVSRGLGRALALSLAKRGHTIIGCARTPNALHSLQKELAALSPSSSHTHLLQITDVASNGSVEELFKAVLERDLVPDILVNNAAVINENSKFWEIPQHVFDCVIDTNVKGTANVLRHFIPLMIQGGKGIIVNFSSMWGRNGAPMFSPYCASKWAIEGLTKSIALELPKGMAIIALDPGIVNTDMLAISFGDSAPDYQNPEEWVVKASTMILSFTSEDNGASLTVE